MNLFGARLVLDKYKMWVEPEFLLIIDVVLIMWAPENALTDGIDTN